MAEDKETLKDKLTERFDTFSNELSVENVYPSECNNYASMVDGLEENVRSVFAGMIENLGDFLVNFVFDDNRIYVMTGTGTNIKPVASFHLGIKTAVKKYNRQNFITENGYIFPKGE